MEEEKGSAPPVRASVEEMEQALKLQE